MLKLTTLVLSTLAILPSVFSQTNNSYVSYANDWVDPALIIAKNFNTSTAAAQQSIVQWAEQLAAEGPWTVMSKNVTPPTGSKHTYMSWAPYSWPNCTGVGNTTELTPEQIWVTCPYYTRDGLFNPDGRLIDDVGNFQDMSDAVLYNSMAYIITGVSNYSANVANFVNTWFIDPATAMYPNLDYAQMTRGPNGQAGTHTGLLDLKGMTKITAGILMLRKSGAPDWTSQLDTQMNNWTSIYIDWLTTNTLAYQEQTATNNHGSFFFNQLASVQILVGNLTGAINATNDYFNGIYMGQINSTGDQPLEAIRTRPYHYRCYNLAAMITNARIADYLGIEGMWNKTTTAGGTIQMAADFAMTVNPGTETAAELYPDVAAVGATYGDPQGKYAAFLAKADNIYPGQPYFLWDQPLSDSNLAAATPTSTTGLPGATKGSHASGSLVSFSTSSAGMLSVVLSVTMTLLWV